MVRWARTVARTPAWPLGLALLGGLLLALGAPPRTLRVGPWLGLSLLCAAQGLLGARGWPWSALLGLAFGFAAHALGLLGLVGVFRQYGGLSHGAAWATAPVLWLLQALPYAIACALTRLALQKRASAALFLPCALTACCALFPQIFPFQPGALAFSWPWLAQAAELSGTSLVTLCMAGTASACVALFRARTFAPYPLLALFMLFVVPQALGARRMEAVQREREAAPTLKAVLVQPDVPMKQLEHEWGRQRALGKLRSLTELSAAATGHVDLTVWPESAYPYPLSRTRTTVPTGDHLGLGTGQRGALLFGTLTYAHEPEEREYNSAWLVRADGTLGERVDKQHLLPFAEYIPFWHGLPFLRRHYRTGGLRAGQSGLVRVAQRPLGVMICYEDLFGSLARAHAAAGAEALVNLTNDAWFGKGHVPALHDALARMRAIEVRRDLLRATNTGVTSFTAATGERVDELERRVTEVLPVEVHLLSTRTLYTRLGDWVSLLCLLACLALWLDARRFR